MGEKTAIAWTNHTFNPWWGCIRVSEACEYCYAETFAKRIGYGTTKPAIWGPAQTTTRRFFGEKHWNEPRRWNDQAAKNGVPELVFCASMADVFEDNPILDPWREKLWELITETPYLTWQLLTKRPERILQAVPWTWGAGGAPKNIWLGTTTETQWNADTRIHHVIRAARVLHPRVVFLSAEPLIGLLSIKRWLKLGVNWVIGGGESGGPKERRLIESCPCGGLPDHCLEDGCNGWTPTDGGLAIARHLRDQCQEASVPFFWKQWGGRHNHDGGRLLDGREWNEMPGVEVPA